MDWGASALYSAYSYSIHVTLKLHSSWIVGENILLYIIYYPVRMNKCERGLILNAEVVFKFKIAFRRIAWLWVNFMCFIGVACRANHLSPIQFGLYAFVHNFMHYYYFSEKFTCKDDHYWLCVPFDFFSLKFFFFSPFFVTLKLSQAVDCGFKNKIKFNSGKMYSSHIFYSIHWYSRNTIMLKLFTTYRQYVCMGA